MTAAAQNIFGSPAQQAILARGRALFELVMDDPRYTYYGRTVGLATAQDGTPERLRALIHLQGNGSNTEVTRDAADLMSADLAAQGLAITRYARLEGGAEALSAAEAIRDGGALPEELTLVWITPDLPQSARQAVADMALDCGVLPPSLEVLSGALKPGLACMAVDQTGRAVSCAAAASYLHPDHRDGQKTCWWGMLATRPERRGQRLSLLLGAIALTEMASRYRFSRFMTGVERGNAASEAVCARMGLTDSGHDILVVADPAQLPGGRMTK